MDEAVTSRTTVLFRLVLRFSRYSAQYGVVFIVIFILNKSKGESLHAAIYIYCQVGTRNQIPLIV